MNKILLSTTILFLLGLMPLSAQTAAPALSPNAEDSLHLDSLSAEMSFDTTVVAKLEKQAHSVSKAMLLSAFIPGAGQVYNRKYIKGVVIAGAEITLGYFTVKKHLEMNSVSANTALADSVRTLRADSLRDLRNTFAFFTLAAVAYSVADAYVDAHLFGFDESLNLSVLPSRQGIGLALLYRF